MDFLSATKTFNFPHFTDEEYLSEVESEQPSVVFDRIFPLDLKRGAPGTSDTSAVHPVSRLLALGNDRPSYAFLGFCAGFGDPLTDWASAHNIILLKASAVGCCDLRIGQCVIRLLHKKGRTIGVEFKIDRDAAAEVLTAPIVIVSVKEIQSAQMFLLSEILGPNKLIGRYLTYHIKGGVVDRCKYHMPRCCGIYGPYQPHTGIGSHEVRHHYWIDGPDTYLTKGGKFAGFSFT